MTRQQVIVELSQHLGEKTKSHGLKTSDIRRLSATFYKTIAKKDVGSILDLSESLLELRKWEYGVIAYDWAFRVKAQYTEQTFVTFERWLHQYITGWGDCDDFCTHAFGALLAQYNNLFREVVTWTSNEHFVIRRASAVVLIYPIKRNCFATIDPFIISNLLMNDPHDLVVKGYGWMLKVLSQYRLNDVKTYLEMNIGKMPRVALRYAIEKMSEHDKTRFVMKTVKTHIASHRLGSIDI